MAEVAQRTVDTLPSRWEVTRLAQRIRDYLPELHARYGIETVALFGSYVRNEQRHDSDLDVLVTFTRTPSLFDLVHLEDEVNARVGVPVDVVLRSELHPRVLRYVVREAVDV